MKKSIIIDEFKILVKKLKNDISLLEAKGKKDDKKEINGINFKIRNFIKVIKSLENLSEDLRELIQHQYPTGYQSSIQRISNAKNEPIFVFPLETEDAVYLVKVPTTKNSDGDYSVQSNKKQDLIFIG